MSSFSFLVIVLVLCAFVSAETEDVSCYDYPNYGSTCNALHSVPYRNTTCSTFQISLLEPTIAQYSADFMVENPDVTLADDKCKKSVDRALCNVIIPSCNIDSCSDDPKHPNCLISCFDITEHCGIPPNWCWDYNVTEFTEDSSNCSLPITDSLACYDTPANLSFCNSMSSNYTLGSGLYDPYPYWQHFDNLAEDLYNRHIKDNFLLGAGCKDTFKNLICAVYFPECIKTRTLPLRICKSMCTEIDDACGILDLFGEGVNCEDQRIYEMIDGVPCAKIKVTGGQCFVATASFGNPQDPNLAVLRSFRDNVLVNYRVGMMLNSAYIALSPPLADFIKETPALRALVRGILLPIIRFIQYPLIGLMTLCCLPFASLMVYYTSKRYVNV